MGRPGAVKKGGEGGGVGAENFVTRNETNILIFLGSEQTGTGTELELESEP